MSYRLLCILSFQVLGLSVGLQVRGDSVNTCTDSWVHCLYSFLLYHCAQAGMHSVRFMAILLVYRALGILSLQLLGCVVLQVFGSASHGGVPSEIGAGAWGRCHHNSPHCALPHPLPRQNHPAHPEPVSPDIAPHTSRENHCTIFWCWSCENTGSYCDAGSEATACGGSMLDSHPTLSRLFSIHMLHSKAGCSPELGVLYVFLTLLDIPWQVILLTTARHFCTYLHMCLHILVCNWYVQ